jgi:chemotaxis protein MotA
METATVIGVIASACVLLGGIIFAGGSPLGFIDPAAGIIIGGGVFCVVLTSFSMDEFKRLPAVAKNVLFYQKPNLLNIINQLVELSEAARRSGNRLVRKR